MALDLLRVDFNELDDDGHLVALLPLGLNTPNQGAEFHLLDADGNYCRGTLLSTRGRLLTLALDWSTWSPEEGRTEVVTDTGTGWTVVIQKRAVYTPERREFGSDVGVEEAARTYAR